MKTSTSNNIIKIVDVYYHNKDNVPAKAQKRSYIAGMGGYYYKKYKKLPAAIIVTVQDGDDNVDATQDLKEQIFAIYQRTRMSRKLADIFRKDVRLKKIEITKDKKGYHITKVR